MSRPNKFFVEPGNTTDVNTIDLFKVIGFGEVGVIDNTGMKIDITWVSNSAIDKLDELGVIAYENSEGFTLKNGTGSIFLKSLAS